MSAPAAVRWEVPAARERGWLEAGLTGIGALLDRAALTGMRLAFGESLHPERQLADALGVVAAGGFDWDYLVRRADKGPRRVLSLLLYATSVDLVVPPSVIRRLHERAFTDRVDEALP